MIQRIEDLQSPPVVGSYYDVPGVVVPLGWDYRVAAGWYPTLGPEHEDAESLDFVQHHWHIDLRFLSEQALRRRLTNARKSRDDIQVTNKFLLLWPISTEDVWWGQVNRFPELEVERRHVKCLRKMPTFPDMTGKIWTALREAHADTCLKTCKVCPHRGVPLGSIPVVDGVITCPGHGLRWDAETGGLLK